MLLVKTRLGTSPIAGIGLFADEDIPAGARTWQFMPGYDKLLTDNEICLLPEPAKSALLEYVYLDTVSGLYVLCIDDARFMNHADDPNTSGVHVHGKIEGHDIATRNIGRGEEITCDYRTFDGHASKRSFLSR